MEEFIGDKRSKAYRAYKAEFNKQNESKSKGLGDTIAKITKATGIDKVVEFVAGDDCGCEERKNKWNKIPMFRRQVPNCIKEDDYNYLVQLFGRLKGSIDPCDYAKVVPIYNYIFNANNKMTSCNACAAKVVNKLKKYLETYR